MRESIRHRLFIACYVLLIVVMFLLPLWSFPGYSLARNTTSHLGAQGSPHAWLMNLTFILIGGTGLLAVSAKLRRYPLQVLLIGLFSLSMAMVGIFRHGPLVEGVERNGFMDRQHSLFASLTGLSFVLFAISVIFISRRPRDGQLALAVGLLATALSAAMAILPGYDGLFQRAIFLIAFGWLIYVSGDAYPLRPGRSWPRT